VQPKLIFKIFQIFRLLGYYWEHPTEIGIWSRKDDLTSPHGHQYKRPLYFDNFLTNLKIYLKSSINPDRIYNESGFNYTKIPTFNISPTYGLLLNGYFQSYKYFDNYRQNILDILDYPKYKRGVINKCPLDNYIKTISLHFRIGDYSKVPKFHTLLQLSYYQRSLKLIQSVNGDSEYRVIYFYEKPDKTLVGNQIKQLEQQFTKMTFLEAPCGLEDWEEMLLMSCCKDNIIANSSFSWWGAYLNDNINKIVCYPSVWFGPAAGIDTKDLCPDSWNKIWAGPWCK
jgi:hypothetical protein